ncbi:MAG: T9SS type A sorting domain-containing protein [Bacteroidales bacterium]|nr:T9SS type A sorting domain-containing protein [Bacteroidales bacterium]MCF8390614.1 T9SS type A sorting domain-containing protein [Bacteroidales bacterium]
MRQGFILFFFLLMAQWTLSFSQNYFDEGFEEGSSDNFPGWITGGTGVAQTAGAISGLKAAKFRDETATLTTNQAYSWAGDLTFSLKKGTATASSVFSVLTSSDNGATWSTLWSVTYDELDADPDDLITETISLNTEDVAVIIQFKSVVDAVDNGDYPFILDDVSLSQIIPDESNVDLSRIFSSTLTVSDEELIFTESVPGSGIYVANDSVSVSALINILAEPVHPEASVIIDGSLYPPSGGADTVDVTILAADGVSTKTYRVVVARSVYQFKIGFLGSASSKPTDWSAGGGYYASSSRGEYGLYPGNNGFRIYNSSSNGEGYLTTPTLSSAGVLSFAAKFSLSSDESLILEKSLDEGSTWIEIKTWLPADGEIPAYVTEDAGDALAMLEIPIHSEGPVKLRFRYSGTSTIPRTMLDDIALTSDQESLIDKIMLPQFLSSNMIFQQHIPVRFWGETVPQTNIIATLENSTEKITESVLSDSYGKWSVEFPEQSASFDPYTITFMVKDQAESKVELTNVLCGDVWFVGGQSNMEKRVEHLPDGEQVAAAANDYPEIRVFKTSYQPSEIPLETVNPSSGYWLVCDSAVAMDKTSAVAYIYALDLLQTQNIPIGLLESYRGGTELETWMSPDIINTEFALHRVKERKELKNPAASDASNNYPSINYNGQINPLIKYPIKGFIFYQGESNTKRALEYTSMMKYLIKDWRTKWDMGNLPFYYVQLFNMGLTGNILYEEGNWQDVRNQQLELLDEDIENIGMVVSIDTNEDPDNPDASIRIHPKNKKPIGHRLALLSRENCYSEAITGTSPFPKRNYVRNDTVFIVFSNVGTGLKTIDNGTLKGFVIADISKNFKAGVGTILNDSTVIVKSSQVSDPVAVRYAWAKNPSCNLANSEDLPASPFKTDDWISLYDYSDWSSYTDASLYGILVNGEAVNGFNPDLLTVEVQLPMNVVTVILEAEPVSVVSNVEITNCSNLNGTEEERTTTIQVTSGNGMQTKTYKVVFTKIPAMDIFIALGQSNMAGRAPITDEVSAVIPNVKLLDDYSNWIEAKNPFNLYSNIRKDASIQQVGPSYSFAKAMEKHLTKPIGMVVNARGGTTISGFNVGGEYHDDIMERIIGLSDFGSVKGIIWHQGESDNSQSGSYMGKLSTLVDALRAELGDVPFIAGQMGGWTKDGESSPKYEAINAVIPTIADHIPNSAFVGNSELTSIGDDTHFNLESQILLGNRYAQNMLSSEYGIEVSIIKVIYSGDSDLMINNESVKTGIIHSFTEPKNEETAISFKVPNNVLISRLSVNGVDSVSAAGTKEFTIYLTPVEDEISLQVEVETVIDSLIINVKESTLAADIISIYPNPVTQFLNIYSENAFAKLLIYNSSGQVVRLMNSPMEIETIDLSHIPEGIYSLQLLDDEKLVVRKFVKSK